MRKVLLRSWCQSFDQNLCIESACHGSSITSSQFWGDELRKPTAKKVMKSYTMMKLATRAEPVRMWVAVDTSNRRGKGRVGQKTLPPLGEPTPEKSLRIVSRMSSSGKWIRKERKVALRKVGR